MGARRFEIAVPAPFCLDFTVWALRRRTHNGVDEWDGRRWRRAVMTDAGALGLTVATTGTAAHPRLAVTLERAGACLGRQVVDDSRQLVTRMLGLEVDLGPFYAMADRDPRLAPLAGRFRGMRPPRFPSVFEAMVNAVACQQLSLDVGIHLVSRLARRFGSVPSGSDRPPALPTAAQLADADIDTLRALGFSNAKATTLVMLARRVAADEIDLEALNALDDGPARDVLVGLRGIGRWSAEYTLLRGLGRLQVLPGDDVGARNGLRRRFGLAAAADYDAVAALSDSWRPYGGLVYFHLLLERLADEGWVTPGASEKMRRPRGRGNPDKA